MNQQSYISLCILWPKLTSSGTKRKVQTVKMVFGSPKSQPEIMGQVVCTLAIKALTCFSDNYKLSSCAVPWAAFHRVIKKRKRMAGFQTSSVESSISLQPFQIKGWISPCPSQGARGGCVWWSQQSPLLPLTTHLLHRRPKSCQLNRRRRREKPHNLLHGCIEDSSWNSGFLWCCQLPA